MSLVNERSANRAASVLNSKPNVDEVDNNLKELLGQSRVPASNNFLYCLPHHHFKLDKGEVLLFDVKEGADGKVEKVSVSVGQGRASPLSIPLRRQRVCADWFHFEREV